MFLKWWKGFIYDFCKYTYRHTILNFFNRVSFGSFIYYTPLLTEENRGYKGKSDKHTTHILGCMSIAVLYCFLISRVAWNVVIEVYNHRAGLTQNCEQNKIFLWLSSKSLVLNFQFLLP